MAVLVKFQRDCNDEFDVYGLRLFPSVESWVKYTENVEELMNQQSEWDWYIGSNDFITFRDFTDVMASFKVTEIGKELSDLVSCTICWPSKDEFGQFPEPEDYLEYEDC